MEAGEEGWADAEDAGSTETEDTGVADAEVGSAVLEGLWIGLDSRVDESAGVLAGVDAERAGVPAEDDAGSTKVEERMVAWADENVAEEDEEDMETGAEDDANPVLDGRGHEQDGEGVALGSGLVAFPANSKARV